MSEQAAAEKKVVRVIIFGQSYTLRVSGAAGETEALAVAVDQIMSQIATRAGTGDPTRIAVLAALHLADRVRQLEREIESLHQRTRSLDLRISALLDNK